MSNLPVSVEQLEGTNYVEWLSSSSFQVKAWKALAINQTSSIAFSVPRPCGLIANVLVAANAARLYDANGNLLGSTSSLAPVGLGQVSPGVRYVLEFAALGGAPAANAALISVLFSEPLITSQWFANGIESVIVPSASLSVAYASYGQATFTFVNYPLVSGQPVPLAVAQNALQSGALTATSSDLAVYTNKNFAFVAGEFLNLVLVPLISTNFSGTIVYNVTGAGTTVNPTIILAGPI